jgi:uncharacterized protein YndB with AHSA1/START domain
VWRAFVEPAELSAWHGTAIEFEARQGGRVLFRDEGYPEVSGRVTAVRPRRLLCWEVDGTGIVITEEFAPSGPGTIVTVRQHSASGVPAHEREASRLGWDESLADMALVVEHGVRYSRHMSRRSTLGAEILSVTAGVIVVRVSPGSCADEAGLRPGDVLVRLGSAPLFGRADVALVTREHPPGTRLEAAYVRAGKILTGTGTLRPRT